MSDIIAFEGVNLKITFSTYGYFELDMRFGKRLSTDYWRRKTLKNYPAEI